MKARYLIPAVLVLVGCSKEEAPPSPVVEAIPDGGPVVFARHTISAETAGCADEGPTCARVTVNVLTPSGGGTQIVRENIDLFLLHDLVARLRAQLPKDIAARADTIDKLVAAFLAQQRAFVEEFPDAPAQWFLEIEAREVWGTASVASIEISEFVFTGGAHPNSRQRLASFDVETGHLLWIDDLTPDPSALIPLVEDRLRLEHGLEPEADLGEAGFWIDEGGLALPDNVALVAEGLRLHWDPYEIAPYSMGSIDIVITTDELTGIVDERFSPDVSSERDSTLTR